MCNGTQPFPSRARIVFGHFPPPRFLRYSALECWGPPVYPEDEEPGSEPIPAPEPVIVLPANRKPTLAELVSVAPRAPKTPQKQARRRKTRACRTARWRHASKG